MTRAIGLEAYQMVQLAFAVESLEKIMPEFEPLLTEHWLEFHGHKPKFNWAVYRNYEAAGVVRVYTARAEGKLVGYIVLFVFPYIHETDWLTAFTDVFYLQPAFREGGNGKRMFEFMLRSTEAEDVRRWRAGWRYSKDLSGFFASLGFDPIEVCCERLAPEGA